MKAIELRLRKDLDKSFIVFREQGKLFPCPWHYHPEYELVLVTKSTGRRMVGDHIGYFKEGDLVFMGPMLPHVWVNDPEYLEEGSTLNADAIVIHFVGDFLGEKFLQVPEMEKLNDFLQLSNRGMQIKGQAREKIYNLMKEIVNMNGMQRLVTLFSIFEILATTAEYELLASPGYVHHIHPRSSDRFSKITDYIMRNFDREITLPEAASAANMAVTTFCNFFKAHYRVTFVEYLNIVRVGHACKLLGDKNKTIVGVAYECGFNNLANFNRQFKKLKNMTPSEYRKTINTEALLPEPSGEVYQYAG
jgi:AraC-like DNA-binding protein